MFPAESPESRILVSEELIAEDLHRIGREGREDLSCGIRQPCFS
jgi:hypothetical protein